MDVDENQCKFPRIGNGSSGRAKKHSGGKDEEEGEPKRGDAVDGFYGWASSRIVRVSRASGGKDRHSKVLTSKGLRDRRVRLSVSTAIQFYDLQDRLGCDQPSKAVEWLLKAAARSIAELPPMNILFPEAPNRPTAKKKSNTLELDPEEMQVTKSSAGSSASETSKGSRVSLSRSESRIKARERAKERVAEKEKEKDNESAHIASFTELLSAPNGLGLVHQNSTESNFFQKSPRLWSSAPMDYFSQGQIQFANSMVSPLFNVAANNQQDIQQFSLVPDNFVSILNAAAGGGNGESNIEQQNGRSEYNFSISAGNSSGLVGYNGGTLQSNSSSPSLLQRFPLIDGSSRSVFIGTAPPLENHHHHHRHHPFLSGFDARLQLSYGDANANNSRHSVHKGKEKN